MKKILWITNILFPEAASLLSKGREIKGSGGWLLGAANAISNSPDLELNIATVSELVQELTFVKGKFINYVLLPLGKGNVKYNKGYECFWKEVNNRINPLVIHIHGTEYSHGLAYVRACGNKNIVVSIQGLTSVCSRYYCAGYTRMELYKNLTLHDILKGSLYREKKRFEERGRLELELLQSVHHIIGRTSWDRSHAWAINPEAKYHFCNETLRDEFYTSPTWEYDKCNKHSIFLSQAYYPIKGFHQIVSALPLVLRHYPDATVRVAGEDVLHPGWLHQTAYIKILNKFIKSNNLQDKIQFTGRLNATDMIREYLSANVFVCPSSIENSPNSLGEAQILGVPHISSYVGGTCNFMKGNEENLYRFEEIEMLAEKICRVFSEKNRQVSLRQEAMMRHDSTSNSKALVNIYESILH